MEPLKTLIALAMARWRPSFAPPQPKVAVFDFECVDTSIEGATNGPRSDEGARLARLDTAKCGSDWCSPDAPTSSILRVLPTAPTPRISDVRRGRRRIRERTGGKVFDDGVGPEGVEPHSQHEYCCA